MIFFFLLMTLRFSNLSNHEFSYKTLEDSLGVLKVPNTDVVTLSFTFFPFKYRLLS